MVTDKGKHLSTPFTKARSVCQEERGGGTKGRCEGEKKEKFEKRVELTLMTALVSRMNCFLLSSSP